MTLFFFLCLALSLCFAFADDVIVLDDDEMAEVLDVLEEVRVVEVATGSLLDRSLCVSCEETDDWEFEESSWKTDWVYPSLSFLITLNGIGFFVTVAMKASGFMSR